MSLSPSPYLTLAIHRLLMPQMPCAEALCKVISLCNPHRNSFSWRFTLTIPLLPPLLPLCLYLSPSIHIPQIQGKHGCGKPESSERPVCNSSFPLSHSNCPTIPPLPSDCSYQTVQYSGVPQIIWGEPKIVIFNFCRHVMPAKLGH